MNNNGHVTEPDWLHDALAEYQQPLTRYAFSILRDPDRAQDVVQDTFVRLCGEDRDRIEDHLAEWLFTVCRNRALDLKRKESRWLPMQDSGAEQLSSDLNPADAAERGELSERIVALMKTLPENQQEVVRLKFQNDFRYEEISRITGLSVSNVGFLLHTAIKKLRTELKKESF